MIEIAIPFVNDGKPFQIRKAPLGAREEILLNAMKYQLTKEDLEKGNLGDFKPYEVDVTLLAWTIARAFPDPVEKIKSKIRYELDPEVFDGVLPMLKELNKGMFKKAEELPKTAVEGKPERGLPQTSGST